MKWILTTKSFCSQDDYVSTYVASVQAEWKYLFSCENWIENKHWILTEYWDTRMALTWGLSDDIMTFHLDPNLTLTFNPIRVMVMAHTCKGVQKIKGGNKEEVDGADCIGTITCRPQIPKSLWFSGKNSVGLRAYNLGTARPRMAEFGVIKRGK